MFVPLAVALALLLYLPLLGALSGLGVGRVTSLVNLARSPAQHVITQERTVQQPAKHWSAGIMWAWAVLFVIAVMLTLSALLADSSNQQVILIVGVVIPLLTLGAILLHERDLRRLAAKSPLLLSNDPVWNERANASLIPRTVTTIKLLEYGLIGAMISSQLVVVVLVSSSNGANSAALLGGVLALHLLSPLVVGLFHLSIAWIGRVS